MAAQRKLSETEIDEQLRISAKEHLRAYLQGGEPRTQKVPDSHETLKIITAQMQIRQAANNSVIKLINLLPVEDKKKALKQLKTKLLPGS